MLSPTAVRTEKKYKRLRMRLSWADKNHRFLYVANPKVACTKIKRDLQALCGFDANAANIHARSEPNVDYVQNFDQSSDAEIDYFLHSPEVFRFTVVRNPYARLVSAYKSKIRKGGDKNYRRVRALIKHRLQITEPEISFAEFVEFLIIGKNKKLTRDRHWIVQTDGILFHQINYSFIGKIENFHNDYHHILKQLQASQALFDAIDERANSSARPVDKQAPRPVIYTEELAQKAYQLYQADFDNFDYHRDSWQNLTS